MIPENRAEIEAFKTRSIGKLSSSLGGYYNHHDGSDRLQKLPLSTSIPISMNHLKSTQTE